MHAVSMLMVQYTRYEKLTINTFKSTQNGHQFADAIAKLIFLSETWRVQSEISTEIHSQASNLQFTITGSDNGFLPNRWQLYFF